MKKMFLFAAIVAVTFVSCNKNEISVEDHASEGIPMTLVASFDAATKVAYEPDGNVLKTTWNASETISVITLDNTANGKIKAIDNFTSTGSAGRSTAEFTGVFNGGSEPVKVIVVYPALYDDGAGKYAMDTYTDYTGSARSYLYDVEIDGSIYVQSTNYNLKQTADNDASHLANYCVMAGEANIEDIKTNKLSATLSNQMTVLKVTATFPESMKGKTLDYIEIKPYDSEGTLLTYNMGRGSSWEYADIVSDPICAPGGSYKSESTLYASFSVPDSGQAVFYLACPYWAPRSAGDKWGFTVTYEDGSTKTTDVVYKVFPSAVTFDRGKVYRMSVSFE